MSVELQKLSEEALTELITWTKGAKSFVVEEAPKYVREVISWGFWSNFFFSVISFMFFAGFVIVFYKFLRRSITLYNPVIPIQSNAWAGSLFVSIVSAIGILASFPVMCINLYSTLYVHIAPRMYFLEYITDLMKE